MRVLAAFFLLVPASAWAQGVKLEPKKPAAGDRATIRVETALDLEIIVKDSEPERKSNMSTIRTEVFKQEVTGLQDGAGATYTVKCESSVLQRALQKENTPFHGRTFIVKRGAAGTTVEASDGALPPSGAEGLAGWEEYSRLLPGGEVAVGAQWVVDQNVTALLSVANLAETKSAKLSATLKSAEGSRAVVSFNGEVEGKTRDGAMIKVSITDGELDFDMGRGRPTAVRITGGLEATKDVIRNYVKPGGVQAVPEPVGTIRMKSSRLEVKVAFE